MGRLILFETGISRSGPKESGFFNLYHGTGSPWGAAKTLPKLSKVLYRAAN